MKFLKNLKFKSCVMDLWLQILNLCLNIVV